VVVVPPPIEFPRMMYYQLWHPRTHGSNAGRWLREQIKTVAASLRKQP
jgi:DNA-binding transcriptional LysR family regulator